MLKQSAITILLDSYGTEKSLDNVRENSFVSNSIMRVILPVQTSNGIFSRNHESSFNDPTNAITMSSINSSEVLTRH